METYVKDGRICVNDDYANDEYIMFQRVQSTDITTLEDGIYDVRTTLWNAATSAEYQSMAAAVVDPEAQLLVEDGKYYLKLNFSPATILGMPAFLSKAYSVNLSASAEQKNTTDQYQSATILGFHNTSDVETFSKQTLRKQAVSYDTEGKYSDEDGNITDEEALEEAVNTSFDTGMLQNNLRYVNTICLDVTNCIESSGIHKDKVKIAFCCDIMDTLYNGIPGSDAGFNTADLMISEPVANATLTKTDITGVEDTVDKSDLEELYKEAFAITRRRGNYAKGTYNAFVPAWSIGYSVYNHNQSTEAEVANAVTLLSEALGQIVDLTELKSLISTCAAVSPTAARCEETTWTAYSEAKTAADALVKSEDEVSKEQASEVTEDLKTAFEALLPSEEFMTTVNEKIAQAEAIDKDKSDESGYETVQNALSTAKSTVSQTGAKYADVYTAYNPLNTAVTNLKASAGFKTEVLEKVTEAESVEQGDYTAASYSALTTAAKNAKTTASSSTGRYVTLETRYHALLAAMDGLEVKGDHTDLKDLIDKAETLDTGKYLDETAEVLEEALAKAKTVDENEDASVNEIETAMNELQAAIDGLRVLADGTYTVPIALWHSSKDEESMGNAALVPNGKLVVEDGKGTLSFSFEKMSFAGLEGYLSSFCLLDNITLNENGYPVQYDKIPATVLEEYDVVDEFNKADSSDANCAGKKYPKQLQISIDTKEELFWAEVYVPVMGSLDLGNQVCRLKVDYSNAKEYGDPEITPSPSPSEAPSPTPSVAPSAAPSATPSASPSATPSAEPSVTPSAEPGVTSGAEPGVAPSAGPGAAPAVSPGSSAAPKSSSVVKKTRTKMKLSKTKYTIKKGKKVKIKVSVTPKGTIKFVSSNKKVAKVTKKGMICARKKGKAKITVSCRGVKKTIKVTVK